MNHNFYKNVYNYKKKKMHAQHKKSYGQYIAYAKQGNKAIICDIITYYSQVNSFYIIFRIQDTGRSVKKTYFFMQKYR